jgi:hypothetical protein
MLGRRPPQINDLPDSKPERQMSNNKFDVLQNNNVRDFPRDLNEARTVFERVLRAIENPEGPKPTRVLVLLLDDTNDQFRVHMDMSEDMRTTTIIAMCEAAKTRALGRMRYLIEPD